jgi:hypothetical protein
MEEITKLMLNIPKEVDYKLNLHLAELRRKSVKTSKMDLILKLLQIGLIQESKTLEK